MVMMISDLPNDLEAEILSRVSAKSLSELKTTCKRWNSFQRSEVRGEEQEAGRLRGSDSGCIALAPRDLHGLYKKGVEPSIMVTGKLGSLEDSKDLIFSHIFHCDGLMLCSTKGNTRFLVWNPCTGQTMNIKPRTPYGRNDTML
ncbi:hypothetical protein Bca4012_098896 [Brassica carinata]|uniref:F-box domain-containing protein n=3 Tax=Brassica TaxID=3705 RepID=A0A0D3EDM0_BRAOL|nr:unnamed protein product [Brassica napus]CDY51876.1 BnaCnng21380D [Brassica napus]VDD61212.1 unnamed protein product [Brassica oleracea]